MEGGVVRGDFGKGVSC